MIQGPGVAECCTVSLETTPRVPLYHLQHSVHAFSNLSCPFRMNHYESVLYDEHKTGCTFDSPTLNAKSKGTEPYWRLQMFQKTMCFAPGMARNGLITVALNPPLKNRQAN